MIASPPLNPIFFDCRKHTYLHPNPKDYYTYVSNLFKVIGKSSKVGTNKQENGWDCILFQEKCGDSG